LSLSKNSKNLNNAFNKKQQLEESLLLNKPLEAYYLKKDLRQIWLQKDKKQAMAYLDNWVAHTRSADIKMLTKLSETLKRHQDGILPSIMTFQ